MTYVGFFQWIGQVIYSIFPGFYKCSFLVFGDRFTFLLRNSKAQNYLYVNSRQIVLGYLDNHHNLLHCSSLQSKKDSSKVSFLGFFFNSLLWLSCTMIHQMKYSSGSYRALIWPGDSVYVYWLKWMIKVRLLSKTHVLMNFEMQSCNRAAKPSCQRAFSADGFLRWLRFSFYLLNILLVYS